MRLNDLGKPKLLFVVCLTLFGLLTYFNKSNEKPVPLHGTIAAMQVSDGVLKAVAVATSDERFVVKFTPLWLMNHKPPELHEKQEVDLQVTSPKLVKDGVVCDFVALVKAGPPPPEDASASKDSSAPDGNQALPVDDLKHTVGIKGM